MGVGDPLCGPGDRLSGDLTGGGSSVDVRMKSAGMISEVRRISCREAGVRPMDLRVRRPVITDRLCNDDSDRTRRRWLRDTALAMAGLATTAWGQAAPKLKAGPGEQDVIDQVQARAKKAGLGAMGSTRTEHFLCLGDSTEAYPQRSTRKICEAPGKDFLTYFRGRGFKVAYPRPRMTVVTLKDVDVVQELTSGKIRR